MKKKDIEKSLANIYSWMGNVNESIEIQNRNIKFLAQENRELRKMIENKGEE